MKRGLLWLALGCASATDDERARSTEQADVSMVSPSEASLPRQWACLREPPSMAAREPERVHYLLPVVDLDSDPSMPMVVPDLNVAVCLSSSCSPEFPRCNGELGQCYGLGAAQAPHVLAFEFPFDFGTIGHLRFSATGYVPLDYTLGGPMVGMPDGDLTVLGRPVPLLSAAAMATLYRSLGIPAVDPTRGVLMLRTLNCEGEPAAGVQLQIQSMSGNFDELAVPYNLAPSDFASDSFETDGRGVAGFISLVPQSFTVTASAPDGEKFASAVVSVRAGTITLAELRLGLGVWGQ